MSFIWKIHEAEIIEQGISETVPYILRPQSPFVLRCLAYVQKQVAQVEEERTKTNDSLGSETTWSLKLFR